MGKPSRDTKIPLFDLPDGLLPAIDDIARRHLGRNDAVGPKLAADVAALSRLYTRERAEIGTDDRDRLVAARLRFFLPRDLVKVMGPLSGLRDAGSLPPADTWSVLDLGAGLGATCLGVARFAHVFGTARALDVVAVDPFAEGLAILEALASRADDLGLVPTRVHARATTMEAALPPGPFDLVLLGLSLNEWARGRSPAEASAMLGRLGQRLTPGGALIVIEPALKAESRFLQETRDAIVSGDSGLHVFAPCTSSVPCPMLARERDWCHAEIDGDLPEPLGQIAKAAGLRRSRRTFSYLTLRQGAPPRSAASSGSAFRVVSAVLASKGKHEIHLCDGSLVRATRLLRHASAANDAFARATRGDLMRLSPLVEIADGKARIGRDDAVELQGIGRATEPPN